MYCKTLVRFQRYGSRPDLLNGGSNMTLGCIGLKLQPEAHRLRMPWTVAKEGVARRVLLHKDKALLEGSVSLEHSAIDRMSAADPLDVLKSCTAKYKYSTSTGKNIFQLASQVPFDGRGQKVFRKEWMQGTYEKYLTLSSVEYNRYGNKGNAYGYITFHGETTLTPVCIDHSDIPGWYMEYDDTKCVPYDRIVTPPPSIGTEVPVDPKVYKLKAYPYYDPPNPPHYIERLLRERGVLPDLVTESDITANSTQDRNQEDESEDIVPK